MQVDMIWVLTIVASFLAGAFAAWVFYKATFSQKLVSRDLLEKLQEEGLQHRSHHAAEVARLQTELRFTEEKIQLQSAQSGQVSDALENQFRVLAQAILNEKSEQFSALQQNGLKAALDPLKEQIKTFRDDYELKRMKESEERISLREQVRQMMDLNRNLSEQAESLAAALRGNVKQQGNWGEMILERILQYAGLQKDVHYFSQQQAVNESGKTIQPDITVHYPGNRVIVIDSKVSLVHFEQYNRAATKDEQEAAANSVIRSFRNHIDGLYARSYQDVNNALDFVMMFVPVEAAFIVALQHDPSVWQYAYNKKILLISPTNLIAAMKLISDMWQRDQINNEAHRIAEKAGKLYDKLASFLENFEKVGIQLNKAQDCWQDAHRQLATGKGNAISQAEQMKKFSGKTSKSLPAGLAEKALSEDRQEL